MKILYKQKYFPTLVVDPQSLSDFVSDVLLNTKLSSGYVEQVEDQVKYLAESTGKLIELLAEKKVLSLEDVKAILNINEDTLLESPHELPEGTITK